MGHPKLWLLGVVVISSYRLRCWLDVGGNVAGEKPGKAVPGRRHSDGHGEGSKGEREGGGPECRPVDTVKRDEIVGDNKQNQDAKAGHSTSSRREPDLIPWKTAKRGFH